MHVDVISLGTVSRSWLCGWLILLATLEVGASFANAEQLASPLTPSVKTKMNGDPSNLPIGTDVFDLLLTDSINRILTQASAQPSSEDRYAVNGTIRATKLDVTWSGCLFLSDKPPGDGACPYPVSPIEYRGPGSIEVMAERVAAQILKIVQASSPVSLYLGCKPDLPVDPTFEFGLTILADEVQQSVTQNVAVESFQFALPCAQSPPPSSAVLDFGASVENSTIVIRPSLAVAGQVEQRLPNLRLPIQRGSDAFATLREYDDELTRLLASEVLASLLPTDIRPERTQFKDPSSPNDRAEAARILRIAGYPKLAGTFVAVSVDGSAITIEPLSVRLEQGLLMLEHGDYEEAFEHLRGVVGVGSDPGSPANDITAYRALIDAAYLARRYGDVVRAGEIALQAPSLKEMLTAKDAIAIRVHLVNAYSLRALACLDQRAECGGSGEGQTIQEYKERVDLATDDLDAAVRHLVFVGNADVEKANEMAALANNLVTAALNLVDPLALRRSDGATGRVSERLFVELREAVNSTQQEIEERRIVLLGRVSIIASVVRAPANEELLNAIKLLKQARSIRNERLGAGGAVAHPLLDFELAEAFAMHQDFVAAGASARAGEEFLGRDTVKAMYASSSWDVLTAIFASLASLSDTSQSPKKETIVEKFKTRFEASPGLPLIETLTLGQNGTRSYPATWKFGSLHLYACTVFKEEVRDVTLAMLDLVFKRESAVKNSRLPECSETIQPR